MVLGAGVGRLLGGRRQRLNEYKFVHCTVYSVYAESYEIAKIAASHFPLSFFGTSVEIVESDIYEVSTSGWHHHHGPTCGCLYGHNHD
jgi:hypothetical protein